MDPKESSACHGAPEDLPTDELLAAVAGSARVRDVVSRYPIEELARESPLGLRRRGLPPAAARRLACAFEVGRRASSRLLRRGEPFRSSQDIFEAFHGRMRDLRLERFMLVMLTAKNTVLREVMVSQGTLTSSLVHPREVFAPAIRDGAAGVVLVHNHPSGDPEPSPEDVEVTRRLCAVGELLGIPVLDHIVVGNGTYASFLDRGLISGP